MSPLIIDFIDPILFWVIMHQGFSDDELVKNPPGRQEMEETGVWSLGQEDTLEKEMASHSSILAWKIPRTEEPSGLQPMGSQRVRHAWTHTHTHNLQVLFILKLQLSSATQLSISLWPHGLQHARLPCSSPTPRACSNSCTSSWWCHPTISSSVVLFSPAFNLSQYQGLFQWVSSLYQVATVLEFQLQHQSFQWIFRTDFL